MKYIISRMLLLINSIIITVPIENTYNTIDNTYNDFDTNNTNTNTNSNDSSEYQEYTTTYQEYSISTNIFMFISLAFYIILYVYKFSVLFTIIEKATHYDETSWEPESININILKKIVEFTCHVLLDIVLIGLLIVPIKYNNIILNIICYFIFIILYSFLFILGFCINNNLPTLTFKELEYNRGNNNKGNIYCKLKDVKFGSIEDIFEAIIKRIKNIPSSIKNIKDIKNIIQYDKWDEKAYVLTDIIMIIMIILIIIGPIITIIPRTITFWSEKGSVIKDINNWISTSNIMRYILRNINNKFNIFKLPIASTNITLSESIFSLLLSSLTFFITYYNHILHEKNTLKPQLNRLEVEINDVCKGKAENIAHDKGNASDFIESLEALKKKYDPEVEGMLIKLGKEICFKYCAIDIMNVINFKKFKRFHGCNDRKYEFVDRTEYLYLYVYDINIICQLIIEKKYFVYYENGNRKLDNNEKQYKLIYKRKNIKQNQVVLEQKEDITRKFLEKGMVINFLIYYIENKEESPDFSKERKQEKIKKLLIEWEQEIKKVNIEELRGLLNKYIYSEVLEIIFYDKGIELESVTKTKICYIDNNNNSIFFEDEWIEAGIFIEYNYKNNKLYSNSVEIEEEELKKLIQEEIKKDMEDRMGKVKKELIKYIKREDYNSLTEEEKKKRDKGREKIQNEIRKIIIQGSNLNLFLKKLICIDYYFKEELCEALLYTKIICQNESKDNFIFMDTIVEKINDGAGRPTRIIKIHKVDKDGDITHTLYDDSKDDIILKIKYDDLKNKSYVEILSYIEGKKQEEIKKYLRNRIEKA